MLKKGQTTTTATTTRHIAVASYRENPSVSLCKADQTVRRKTDDCSKHSTEKKRR